MKTTRTTLTLEALEDRAVPASLSVNDISLTEGNSGSRNANFTVSLTSGAPGNVTVNYATQDNTAQATYDYGRTSGSLTFKKGETSKTVSVPIYGDRLGERDEVFRLILSNASGATINRSTANCTIISDDPRTFVFLLGGYVLPTQPVGRSGLEKLQRQLNNLPLNAIISPVLYYNYDLSGARNNISQHLRDNGVTSIDRVVLIGHSSGGYLAYQLASNVDGTGRKASAIVTLDPIQGEGSWTNKDQSRLWLNIPSGMSGSNVLNIVQRNPYNDSWLNSFGFNIEGATNNYTLAGGANGATHNSIDDDIGIGPDHKIDTADDTRLGIHNAIFDFVNRYVSPL